MASLFLCPETLTPLLQPEQFLYHPLSILHSFLPATFKKNTFKIHLRQAHNSLIFSKFTKSYNHHYNLVLDYFYHPKKIFYAYF